MSTQSKIYIAGHLGMVGSAIVRALQLQSQPQIIVRSHAELDLTNQAAVRAFFESEKPDQQKAGDHQVCHPQQIGPRPQRSDHGVGLGGYRRRNGWRGGRRIQIADA